MSGKKKPAKAKGRGRQPSGHGMPAVPGLRATAEAKLAEARGSREEMAEETAERGLHELQVHQIELEMQNEELRRAQMALEESRDKYLDLYDFAPVGYFTLSRKGEIVEANLAGAAMLGLERPKLVHRGLSRFVAPGSRDRWDQHLVSVLHSADKQSCELTFRREDGSTLCAQLDSIRLDRPAHQAGDGDPCPMMRVAMSDISDLKRAHGKLTESLAQLARSNRELESFAYVASHDLKGPLITITGFLESLAINIEQGNTKAMHSDLTRIGEATRKMDRLLNDLLELSRIGHVVGSLEDVSLTELAREVASLLDGSIAEKKVRVEISPNLPTVRGERARLTQLMMNLLSNAVKFMGRQSCPQVKIGVRRDGGKAVCYVRDNGVGIAPQHNDRIFGLFQQLDPSLGGTGIGLSVAKRVVETHGGRIWIESDGLGKGSTFCFTLVGKAEPVAEEAHENGQ